MNNFHTSVQITVQLTPREGISVYTNQLGDIYSDVRLVSSIWIMRCSALKSPTEGCSILMT